MTDSLRGFLAQKAINSCWEDNQSAKALCWEDAVEVIKVIALTQQALLGKEETRFSFAFNFGGCRPFLKGELEGSREVEGRARQDATARVSFCCSAGRCLPFLLRVPDHSQQGSRTQAGNAN